MFIMLIRPTAIPAPDPVLLARKKELEAQERASDNRLRRTLARMSSASPDTSQSRIVIVPGDPRIKRVIEAAFDGIDCPTIIEADPSKAWQMVEDGDVDLICLDLGDKATYNSGIAERLAESRLADPVAVFLFGGQPRENWFKRAARLAYTEIPARVLMMIEAQAPALA